MAPIFTGNFFGFRGGGIIPRQFIGTSNTFLVGTNVTSTSVDNPVGSQPGDLAIVMLSGNGGANSVGDWANSQGFTFLYENTVQTYSNASIAYKVLDGSEGASFTFTTTGSTKQAAVCVVYRNTRSIYSSSENLQSASSTPTANSINAISPNILFAFFVVSAGNVTFTNPPSDLTLLHTLSTANNFSYWIGYKTVTESGPTGNYQITSNISATSGNFLFSI